MPPAPTSALSVADIRRDSDQRFAQLLDGATSTDIFSQYSRSGTSQRARNFTGRLNFSGIAWDDSRTATLVSPVHVVMARHYPRPVGATLAFHDPRGKLHQRTLTAVVPLTGITDVCVGKLDAPLPASVPFYRVLPPSPSNPNLAGCLAVVTNQYRQAHIHEINRVSGIGMAFRRPDPDRIPPNLTRNVVKGDSGNPSFLLVGGELVLIETHSTGGMGAGPFYSSPEVFDAINQAMLKLGGGARLTTVPVREDR